MLKKTCSLNFVTIAAIIFSPSIVFAQPLQFNSQQINASAVAIGEGSTAINHIHQSSHQRQQGMQTTSQSQISMQQVDATSVALGNHATAINNIRQFNRQSMRRMPSHRQSQISGQQVNANKE